MNTRSKIGRPTRLNVVVANRIIEAIEAGSPYRTAALASGIGYSTFHAWMRRGLSADPDDGEFKAFRNRVKRGRAKAEQDAIANIRRAAREGSWQADAWFLERSNPRRWGRVDRLKAEISAKAESAPDWDEWRRKQIQMLSDPKMAELAAEIDDRRAELERAKWLEAKRED
jgi:hypothetical protein